MADLLRDGIHELRIWVGRVNYRLLYFFHGRDLAVPGHAIRKRELFLRSKSICIRRERAFESDPEGHTYSEEEEGSSWQRLGTP